MSSSVSRMAATRSSPISSAQRRSTSSSALLPIARAFAPFFGEVDDLGPAVGGIRHALDVAEPLEVVDGLADGLLGQPRAAPPGT